MALKERRYVASLVVGYDEIFIQHPTTYNPPWTIAGLSDISPYSKSNVQRPFYNRQYWIGHSTYHSIRMMQELQFLPSECSTEAKIQRRVDDIEDAENAALATQGKGRRDIKNDDWVGLPVLHIYHDSSPPAPQPGERMPHECIYFSGLGFILRLPPGSVVTFTNLRLYKMRFFARPLGVFFFSCLSTFGVCDLTLPARARDP